MFKKNKYRETANNASENERILPHNFKQHSNRKMNETVESENERNRRIEKQTKQSNRKMNETVESENE